MTKTIELPEPCRKPLKKATYYYIPVIDRLECSVDKIWLPYSGVEDPKSNLVYDNLEDAIQASKSIIKVLGGKV